MAVTTRQINPDLVINCVEDGRQLRIGPLAAAANRMLTCLSLQLLWSFIIEDEASAPLNKSSFSLRNALLPLKPEKGS